MLLHSSLPAVSLLLAISLPTLDASLICAVNLYGRPLLSDAIAISKTLPYVKSDPTHQMDARRVFAEPAFFTPRFQGMLNPLESAMVQLPRVWRYSGSSPPFAFRHQVSCFEPRGSLERKRALLLTAKGHEQGPHASPFSCTPTPPAKSLYPASPRTGASSRRPRLA